MRKSFGSIIIGVLFIFLDIRVGAIDVFLDPIGYWFIYYGVIRLMDEYPVARRAKNSAAMLAFLTIPTVFISMNAVFHPLSFLGLYMPLLQFLMIIFMFFLFQLMLQIADKKGYQKLYKQTRLFMFIYISVKAIIFLIQLFSVPGMHHYMIGLSSLTLGLNVVFLGWLFRFRMFPETN
ncbi:MAG TPA: hypothetical protein VK111_08500 [Virgibacillus sp.]|nr:hypothetical protein [Virgibacillus sp.]